MFYDTPENVYAIGKMLQEIVKQNKQIIALLQDIKANCDKRKAGDR